MGPPSASRFLAQPAPVLDVQVMRLRFRCDESVSRTNNKLFSSDFLLYLPPLVSDNT